MSVKKLADRTAIFILAHPRLFSISAGIGITYLVGIALGMIMSDSPHQAFGIAVFTTGAKDTSRCNGGC